MWIKPCWKSKFTTDNAKYIMHSVVCIVGCWRLFQTALCTMQSTLFINPHPLNHGFSGRGTPICNLHFLGGGGGAENVTYNPLRYQKYLVSGRHWTILDDGQIDQTCFQPMADPGTFSWRGEHSTGVPRSNTDVPGSASGRSGNIHADEIIRYNRKYIEIYLNISKWFQTQSNTYKM
jgi:hypothetical protein